MKFGEIINNRRAVNFFDPNKKVPEDQLKSVVELASKTPSSFNLQPWNLIVLRDYEDKTRLRKLAWNQPKVSEAPVVLIVLADRDGWREDNKFVEKNFQKMIKAGSMSEEQREWFKNARASLYGHSEDTIQAFACKNTGFFIMSLMLAAKSLGLDTHPMDGFDHEGVRKEFKIPENYWIPVLLAIGYFDKKKQLSPPKWRKTFDEIVVRFDAK